jgi:hypothetical protein
MHSDLLSSEIQADVAESIRVIRSRKGFETQIDLSEEKTERIDKYIDLLEFRMHLDAECDPGTPTNSMYSYQSYFSCNIKAFLFLKD